uniref:Uncharacterized protein n=1 Tax=Ditylenchus dipsaci TaxID=166011 RepID=A0A915EBY4_9BILA
MEDKFAAFLPTQDNTKWTLKQDAQLRECLEEFTNKLMSTMSQLQNTEKKLEIDSERLVLRIENIHNNIAALKMTKFVDERIIDVPSEVLKKAENPHLHTQDDKSSHEEKTTNAIKIAVKQGLQLISDQFREVNLVGPDFFADVDPNFVPDPIFEAHQQYLDRKLPAIIGSQQFNASPTAGLFDFSSSTPSSSTNVTIRLPQNQPAESSHTPASVEVKQPHSALIDVGSTLTAAAHSHETSEVIKLELRRVSELATLLLGDVRILHKHGHYSSSRQDQVGKRNTGAGPQSNPQASSDMARISHVQGPGWKALHHLQFSGLCTDLQTPKALSQIQAEQSVTISMAYPFVQALLLSVRNTKEEGPPTIKSLAIALENELDRVFAHMLHYNTINYEPLYIMATALDPNYAKVLEEVDVDRACISIAYRLKLNPRFGRLFLNLVVVGLLFFGLTQQPSKMHYTSSERKHPRMPQLHSRARLWTGKESRDNQMVDADARVEVVRYCKTGTLGLHCSCFIVANRAGLLLGGMASNKLRNRVKRKTLNAQLQNSKNSQNLSQLDHYLKHVHKLLRHSFSQLSNLYLQAATDRDKKQGLLFTSSSESEEDEMSKPVMKSFDANFSDRLAAAIKQGPVAMRSTRESDGLSKRPVSMSSVPAGKGGEAGDRGSVGNSLRASVPRTTNSSVSSNEELGPSSVASRISQIGDKIPIGVGRTSAANKKPVEDEQSNVNQAKPVILNDTAKDRPKGPARRAPSTLRKPDSSTENATTDSGKPPLAVRTEEKQAVNTPKVSVKTSTQSEKDLMSSLKATIKPSTTGLAPTAVQPDFNKAKIKSIFDSSSSGDDELASSKSATTTKTTAKLPNTQAKPALFASTTTSGATKSVAKPKKSLFEDSDSE